jgi:hypothetical protein
MASVSRRGCWDGFRRRVDPFELPVATEGNARRGMWGRIDATYSPKYRHARAIANVANVYTTPSTAYHQLLFTKYDLHHKIHSYDTH